MMKNEGNNLSELVSGTILNSIKGKSILALFFLSTLAFGQNITPLVETVMYEKTSRPCLAISVEPSPELLREEWEDYMKSDRNIKLKGNGFLTNKDVLYAEQVVIKNISDRALDLYTEIIKDENGETSMKVFAAFGYDIFIEESTYPTEFAALKVMMSNFLNEYIPEYYNEQIKAALDEVKDLTKLQDKLGKSIKKNNKKISKMTDDIEDREKDNKENQSELEETATKLKAQKERLVDLKAKLNGL